MPKIKSVRVRHEFVRGPDTDAALSRASRPGRRPPPTHDEASGWWGVAASAAVALVVALVVYLAG